MLVLQKIRIYIISLLHIVLPHFFLSAVSFAFVFVGLHPWEQITKKEGEEEEEEEEEHAEEEEMEVRVLTRGRIKGSFFIPLASDNRCEWGS